MPPALGSAWAAAATLAWAALLLSWRSDPLAQRPHGHALALAPLATAVAVTVAAGLLAIRELRGPAPAPPAQGCWVFAVSWIAAHLGFAALSATGALVRPTGVPELPAALEAGLYPLLGLHLAVYTLGIAFPGLIAPAAAAWTAFRPRPLAGRRLAVAAAIAVAGQIASGAAGYLAARGA